LTSTYQDLVDTLREELRATREQLRMVQEEARDREQTHREELAWLRHQFDQMQQRYDRLLEAPRSAGIPTDPAQQRPHTPPNFTNSGVMGHNRLGHPIHHLLDGALAQRNATHRPTQILHGTPTGPTIPAISPIKPVSRGPYPLAWSEGNDALHSVPHARPRRAQPAYRGGRQRADSRPVRPGAGGNRSVLAAAL
jgi:hypothetical protein